MLNAYLFVKRNRFRKKSTIYKQLWQISFDVTTTLYTLLLLGYVGGSWIIFADAHALLSTIAYYIEITFTKYIRSILLSLPMFYLVRAVRHPGVLFTSAEQMLTILPFSRQRIWALSFGDNILKMLLVTAVASSVIMLVTTLSLPTVLLYGSIFFWLHSLLTLVQWKLFQFHFLWKMTLITTGLMLLALCYLTPQIGNILYWLFIVILVLYTFSKLFTNVAWQEVVHASDFIVWNMPIVAQATKMKFKKAKKLGLWQRFSFWRKPFSYEKEAILHRLWYIYMEKNSLIIFKWLAVLALLLIVPGYFHIWYFVLACIITLYLQTSFMLALLRGFLAQDLLATLPWDVKELKQTFLKWSAGLSVVLIVPLIVYTLMYFSALYLLVVVTVVAYSFLTLLEVRFLRLFHAKDEAVGRDKRAEIVLIVTGIFSVFAPFSSSTVLLACILLVLFAGNRYRKQRVVR